MTEARTFADQQPYPSAIAVDRDHVYWTSAVHGIVLRAPKAGGAPELLASELGCALSLSVDDEAVFVAVCEEDGAIVRLPKQGGEPEAIASGQAFPACLTLDDARVYWTTLGDDRDSGTVCSVDRHGEGLTVIASGQIGPDGIGVDADHVYWLTHDDCVWRAPKAGGPAVALHRPHEIVEERLLAGEDGAVEPSVPRSGMVLTLRDLRPPSVRRLAVFEETVYWQNAAGMIAAVDGWDAERGAASTPLLLAIDRSGPADVVADRESVYWIDHAEGRVMRVPRSGGRPRVFAEGQAAALSIAMDEESVYWAVAGTAPSYADGAVRVKRKSSLGRAWRR